MLLFLDGTLVKEVFGAALNDVEGSVECERPEHLINVPFHRLVLVDGQVVDKGASSEEVRVQQSQAFLLGMMEGYNE